MCLKKGEKAPKHLSQSFIILKVRFLNMLTVLFVILVLALFSKLLSAMDGQSAASPEVSSYLHYEYNMERGVRPTMTQLRNL